jgi:hypothetical protein
MKISALLFLGTGQMTSPGSNALRAPLPNIFLQRRALRGAAGIHLEKVRVSTIFAGQLA